MELKKENSLGIAVDISTFKFLYMTGLQIINWLIFGKGKEYLFYCFSSISELRLKFEVSCFKVPVLEKCFH